MEKIQERLEEKLKNAASLDEAIQACAEEGITVTKEQLEAVLSPDPEGELNEEALDNVSGGVIDWTRRILRSIQHGPISSGGCWQQGLLCINVLTAVYSLKEKSKRRNDICLRNVTLLQVVCIFI